MIRAILVDDEPLALTRLERMLQQSGVVEVVGAFTHPTDAVTALSEKRPDVFFLDIEMMSTDGLSLADQLMSLAPSIKIVFVTAYNQYAVDAFELNALDYLLKPVRSDRLSKTLERISKDEGPIEKETKLKVVCFGGFQVLLDADDSSALRWRTSKAQELFAFLIHRRGQRVRRQTLLDTLWGHLDGEKAAAHFHTTLYYLRQSLVRAGFPGLIQYENGLYSVNTSRMECDYYEWDSLTSGNSGEIERTGFSNRFVGLYQGRYLEGEGWLWAEATKQALEERYISVSLQLHEKYLEEGDLGSAIQILKEALRVTSVNEMMYGKLIQVYMSVNDPVAAKREYEGLRGKLQAECGTEPSDTIKNMFH